VGRRVGRRDECVTGEEVGGEEERAGCEGAKRVNRWG